MTRTRLEGGIVIDFEPLRVGARNLCFDQGEIVEDEGTFATSIDCSGTVILPGLVLGHTHLYSGLAIGMPSPRIPPTSFREILERVWWRLDRALDEKSIEFSAKVAAMAAIRAGVTCIIDHHESPNFIDGSLDVIERVLRGLGLRGVLTYGATDRNGSDGATAGLRESARFAKKNASDGSLRGMIGLHAPFTVSDETLAASVELAKRHQVGLHLHAAEGPDDQLAARMRWNVSLFDRLHTVGALDAKTLIAHAVDVSSAEVEVIARSKAFVAHQARSNMNNGVGYANASALLPRVALGTDGIDGDVLLELQAAFFRRREALGPASWPNPVDMLSGGHRLASSIFDRRFDTLMAGSPADITVLTYDPKTPLNANTLGTHLIFGTTSKDVRDVFVGGVPILRDRAFVGVDERETMAHARVIATSLFARMENI